VVRRWIGQSFAMASGEVVTVRDVKMARNNRINLELGSPAGVFYLTGNELEINLQSHDRAA
jgi:hypothetical protein